MPFEKERVCKCVCVWECVWVCVCGGGIPWQSNGLGLCTFTSGAHGKKKKNKERESMGEENKTEQ